MTIKGTGSQSSSADAGRHPSILIHSIFGTQGEAFLIHHIHTIDMYVCVKVDKDNFLPAVISRPFYTELADAERSPHNRLHRSEFWPVTRPLSLAAVLKMSDESGRRYRITLIQLRSGEGEANDE